MAAPDTRNAQALSVKRAEVEFHNFASLGDPERAIRTYLEENHRRSGILRAHLGFIGELSPFLEVGANAGHTSYMLANEFGADGFALDLSADALRHGVALMDCWNLKRAPIRIAGDALQLPFRAGSLRFVMACQTLSQFMDIESVFVEIKRVLAPGGVFLFAEEPLRRLLSLRLYRCPYQERMKPWERLLFKWGLLGYLVKDVIGAEQEESFGIRQNHTMYLKDWHALIGKHFVDHRYHIVVPERGWGESAMKKLAVRLDPQRTIWRAAHLLGGTLAASCRKEGSPPYIPGFGDFEDYLRCPDCHGKMARQEAKLLCETCGYQSKEEGGVFNLLPSTERAELYPGDREDAIDFSLPSHSGQLLEGWYALEGVYGNRFRWIGARATAKLRNLRKTPQKVRIRGHVHELALRQGQPLRVVVSANGNRLTEQTLDRTGLFVIEAAVPDAAEYLVEIQASPTWNAPGEDRTFTVNISGIRLLPIE